MGGRGALTQTEVDTNGLQGGKGEKANSEGHEPVCKGSQEENGQPAGLDPHPLPHFHSPQRTCIIVITHQQGPNCKAEEDEVEKLICKGRGGGEFAIRFFLPLFLITKNIPVSADIQLLFTDASRDQLN